jgi:phosphohistidine phosphatase SixA
MSKGELSVFMPMRLKKRGGRKMVLVPEGKAQLAAQNSSIDTTLVKALVRAHLWQRQLKSGKYQTMQDLCDANKVTAKYVQLILRLNFLAPKLKEAILLGHQPRHRKLADLMQNIPSLWHEQGELLGCEVV